MQITGGATHLRHSPRKVNLVVKTIVGLPVDSALERLQFTLRRTANPITTVLKQAIANAVNNFKLDRSKLVVKEAYATKGRTIKGAIMGGRSRYKPFQRTASHLTIKLEAKTK